ncbi:hypothetical protein V6N12_071271 [Hibiscus sabdariffa]|uniref:Uncharacterized protein n=1 Tax=Hibiscus sabdariffa TaxID=183260 RepID=A0ABR2FJI5_9ROSI
MLKNLGSEVVYLLFRYCICNKFNLQVSSSARFVVAEDTCHIVNPIFDHLLLLLEHMSHTHPHRLIHNTRGQKKKVVLPELGPLLLGPEDNLKAIRLNELLADSANEGTPTGTTLSSAPPSPSPSPSLPGTTTFPSDSVDGSARPWAACSCIETSNANRASTKRKRFIDEWKMDVSSWTCSSQQMLRQLL